MKTTKITAYPEDQTQMDVLEAVMKALKIRFELSKGQEKDNYDPVFVEKVLESRQQAREGKVTRIDPDDLKDLLGL